MANSDCLTCTGKKLSYVLLVSLFLFSSFDAAAKSFYRVVFEKMADRMEAVLEQGNSADIAPMAIPVDLPWAGSSCGGETIILQSGIAAVTCGVTTAVPATDRYTFALIDIDGAIPDTGRADVTGSQSVYHHPSWKIDSIGNVFGTAINNRTGDILLTASSNYGSGFFGSVGLTQYGMLGGGVDDVDAAGTIYKVDGVTGQASVFAQLPQQLDTFFHWDCEFMDMVERSTGVGLGNITYDERYDQFFVSNIEDGRIYRLNSTGTILDSYDPFTYDDGVNGISILTETVYGIAVEPGSERLFFGTIDTTMSGTLPGEGLPSIYSIDLSGGAFVGTIDNSVLPAGVPNNYIGTETHHTDIPVGSSSGCTYVNNSTYFISDLSFTPNDQLLVGVRVGCELTFHTSYNHWGESSVVSKNGNLYNGTILEYDISFESCGLDDSYGGVANWELQDGSGNVQVVVSSGDILAEIGPHGIAVFSDTVATTNSITPLGAISYGQVDNGDPKGVGGDVEVFSKCSPCASPITSTVNYSGCQGDGYSVEVNGTIYNQSNATGTEILTSHEGCDSTVTISLVYNIPTMGTFFYTGCSGDGFSVEVNGTIYSEVFPFGTEIITGGNANGCDSTVLVALQFNDPSLNDINDVLCEGSSIMVNGTTYNEANPIGSETIVGGASSGCDSVISIALTFQSASFNSIAENRCEGDGYSITVNGVVYNEANPSGTETIAGGNSFGCDSIIAVSLVFYPESTGVEMYDGCMNDGYSVNVNGTVYNQANPTGTEVLTNFVGCDSTVSVNLVFKPNSINDISETLCQGGSLTVNGTAYNQLNPSGTETINGGAANGCDSIINVSLTFHSPASNLIEENHCEGDGYSLTVNGTVYNQANPSGTETLLGASINGCDSTVSVNLIFNPTSNGSENYEGCEGDGYSVNVNGTVYNEANPNGTETLPNAFGCDSTVVVDLNFNAPSTTNINETLCTGSSLTVNGTIYDELNPSGTETISGGAANGCDSIVNVSLTFNSFATNSIEESRCEGDGFSVTVNGMVYNEASPVGTETIVGGSYLGCDSVITVNLIFNPSSNGMETYEGCTGDGYSVVVNGTLYNESNSIGTETISGGNFFGCDSTISVNLIFNPTSNGSENYDGCEGDGYSVNVNGTVYNEANPNGTETLPNAFGCDSTVVVDLNFNAPSTTNINETLCTGGSLTVNGTIYDELNPSGTETIGGGAANGCDSIINVSLTFTSFASNSIVESRCEGDGFSVTVNGTIYNETNPIGTETIVGGSYLGCDSVITVSLLFAPVSFGNENYLGCDGDGYSVTVNGTLYNQANPAGTEILTNAAGCDSTVTIELVFAPNGASALNEIICEGSSYFFDGQNLTTAGTYFDTLMAGNGCDSVVTLNLTVQTASEIMVADSICAGETYEFMGQTLTNFGTYHDTLYTTAGCDSIRATLVLSEKFICGTDFDMALEKRLANGQSSSVVVGDMVTYNVKITNEGDFASYNILVIDYVPSGLTFVAGSSPGWVNFGAGPTWFYTGPLAPGASDSLNITFTVNSDATAFNIDNCAEISAADDDTNGGNTPPTDVDSTPNAFALDDLPSEDDHDCESLNLVQPILSLGNLVFHDIENDGLFNNDDFGLEEVEVTLFEVGPDGEKGTADDVEIATQETNGFGEYFFQNLIEGLYYVKLSGNGIPAGYVSSTGEGIYDNDAQGPFEPFTGTDNDVDNEDDGSQMGTMIMSDTIRLTVGGEPGGNQNLTVDFGLYEPQPLPGLSLGNLVFHDKENDGLFNNDDSGIEEVEVQLFDVGPDGQKNTADDVELATQETNGFGEYLFQNLAEGLYFVKLTGNGIPTDFVSSTGEGIYDDDAQGPFEPFAGTDNNVDNDDDGSQMGAMIMSDTIRLTVGEEPGMGDTVNLTVDFGLFAPQPLPTLSLGNLVFHDKENDGLFNNDDSGIEEVEVQLFDVGPDGQKNTADDVELATQETNGFGEYLFDGLSEGLYYVKLTGSGIPSDFVSSTGDGPFDMDGAGAFEPFAGTDNDVDNEDDGSQMGVMVMSDTIRLTLNGEPGGNVNLTVDFGFYQPQELLSLGNFVFHDKENDGLFNNDDSGIEEVEVQLFDVGPDGQKNTADDVELATQETNGFGEYLFDNLMEGLYYVKLSGAGIPSGFVSSTGEGIYDNDASGPFEPFTGTENDVDNEDDGTQMGAMVMSDTIRLIFNQEPQVNYNPTVDFGLYQPDTFDLALVKILGVGQSGIALPGDTVAYSIVVINQGTVDAFSVEVRDSLPAGMSFEQDINPGWSLNGDGTVSTTITGPIKPDSMKTVSINAIVSLAAMDGDLLENGAEISSADDDTNAGNGTPDDIDSTPDENMSNDTFGGNDVTDNTGGDEDDQDTEIIEVNELPTLSLGNLVFDDKDNDGVFNNDDTGIEDVEVQLFEVGPDGEKNTADDVEIGTQMTNGFGEYLFDGLAEGLYFVKLTGTGIPTDFVSSTGDGIYDMDGAGAYEPIFGTDNNVDGEDDGTQMGAMVMSDTIRLTLNEEPNGNVNTTVDFGLYMPQPFPTLSLGNLVFNDVDNNGLFEGNDIGIEGVEVQLFEVGPDGEKNTADDVEIGTQMTNGFGEYLFDGLAEGLYYVKLTGTGIPTDFVSSTGDGIHDLDGAGPFEPFFGTDNNVDNEDDGSQMGAMVMSDTIRLAIFQEPDVHVNLTVDFGLYFPQELLSLGNLVFHDMENDGVFNNDDTGIEGVETELYGVGPDGEKVTADDIFVASVSTNSNGNYQFNGLGEGLYYVKLTGVGIPADFVSSTGDGPFDTDGAGAFEPFTGTDNDVDNEDDGTQMGAMVMSDTIRLMFNQEPGVNNNPTVDFGLYDPIYYASLGDFVWYDNDRDGQQDAGENGVEGVTVQLFDLGPDGVKGGGDDVLIDTKITGTNGAYLFEELIPGDYYVMFDLASLPTNYNPTTSNSGSDATDSDANAMGMTEVVTLLEDEFNPTIDMGIEPEPASLGDFVWFDNDRDGQQDAGENGVEGVTVQLFDLGPDGVKGGGDDNLLDTDVTDTDGAYSFANLEPGDYYVMFDLGTLPTGYLATTMDNGNDATDSDANAMGMTEVVNLSAGENDPTIDMGIEPEETGLGDFVWFDNDRDGQQDLNEPGVPNVTVQLFDLGPDGVKGGGDDNLLGTDVTDANGMYGFPSLDPGEYYVMFDLGTLPANHYPSAQNVGNDLTDSDANAMGMTEVVTLVPGVFNPTIDMGIEPEPASLGDFVWFDNDRDGQQDAGENGVEGVTVQLFDLGPDGVKGGGDDNLLDTDVTDTDGAYGFANLEPGDYYVMFDLGTLPTGYETTGQNSGNDATDSDANAMGMTEVVNLSAGENDPTIDMGIVPEKASLGNFVWNDTDLNGQQDAGEVGVSEVTVYLYDLGPDGVKGGGDDNLLGTDVTDANGIYGFENLEPGDYYVQFDLTTIPTNYYVTTQDTGNDASDSDVNFMGMTEVVNLSPAEDDLTIDMGIYDPMFDLALAKSLSSGQPSQVNLGDEVKYTIRIDNQGLIAAYGILITDHLPQGMSLSPNDTLWTSVNDSTATYTLAGPIQPGQSDSVEIILRVVYGLSNASLVNVAEIDSAEDQNGVTVNDIDSTPDNGQSGEDDQDDEPITLLEHDPTGYIYCEKTGSIITGGTISVTGPNGIPNDEVVILNDGSTGFYEFYSVGLPGIYTLSYTHPSGMPMSVICEEEMGAFDPTGPSDHSFGSEQANGFLLDTTCANNPYYLQFDLEPGDPNIFLNNIPMQCVFIGSFVCEDTDLNDQADGTEPFLPGVTVNLYDCADTLNPIGTTITDANGRYRFDGLLAGDYRVQFVAPGNYRVVQGSALSPDGFANCVTLDFGDCDTTTSTCMIPCATVNAGNDVTICLGDTTQLSASPNYGTGGFTWSPATNLTNANIANPEAFPTVITDYTVTYNDGLGCSDTDIVRVNVASTVPMLLSSPFTAQTVECTENIPFEAPLFGDACDNNLNITLDSTVTALSCGYIIERTWTATNNEGNSTQFTQTVTVEDNTAPVLTASHPVIGNLTHGGVYDLDCSRISSSDSMVVSAFETCTIIFVDFSETSTPGDCATDGYLQSMYCGWTAIDTCGNEDSLFFTILIRDMMPPVLNGVPADVAANCGSVPAAPVVTATDLCDSDVTVTMSENTVADPSGCASQIIRTWTSTDDCGNVASESQTITLSDTEAPVLTLTHPMLAGVMDGDTMYMECQDIVSLSADDATATDNCCGVEIDFQEFVTAGNCADDGYVQFMTCGYVATDCCGNTDSFFFHVVVLDNTAPALYGVPADLTLECTNTPPSPSAVTAVDNCENNLTVDFMETSNGNTITRTWTSTDNCGNTGTEIQTITLGATNVGPLISNVPNDTIVSCENGLPPVPNDVVATDDCDPDPMLTFNQTDVGDCGGSVVRTWIAIDAEGNSSMATQTITMEDNTAPVISGVGMDESFQCAPSIIVNPITVSDNCTANPMLILDTDTTVLACGYSIEYTYTATDDCGNTTVESRTVTVNDTENPVLTGVPADLTLSCDETLPVAAMATATDNCGTPTLDFVETSNGTCPEIITRTWTATDACGNSVSASQTITVEDNEAPTMMASHPFFGTIEHGDTLYADCTQIASLDSLGFADSDNCSVPVRTFDEEVTAGDCLTDGYLEWRNCGWTSTDACGNTDSLFFVVIISDNEAPVISGVPADLTLSCDETLPVAAMATATDNCGTPTLDFVETSNGTCPEIITRTWTATDACGNSVSASQTITVEDNEAPTMMASHPFFGTIEHGDTLYADCTQIASLDSLGFADSDNCSVPVRTFDEVVTAGDCLTDGYLEWRNCGWTSTDACGNTDSLFFVVIISDNEAPVISGVPADVTVTCQTLPDTALVTATDICGSVTINVSDVTVGSGCSFSIERTWTATDSCGNTDSATQIITVDDTESPLLLDTPADVTVACGNIPPAANVTAEDTCDPDVPVDFSETINGGDCPYTITRIWSATDDCGNEVNHTQTITVSDDEAPVFDEPMDLTVDCENIPAPLTPMVTDNCDTNLVINFVEEIEELGCGQTITWTWTAVDDCGNMATVDQVVNVTDDSAPQISFNHPLLAGLTDGDVLTMECDDTSVFGAEAADAIDNCSNATVAFFESGLTAGDCAVDGYLVTMECSWIATDDCGNADTLTLTMQVVDSNAPSINDVPAEVTVECGEPIPAFGNPTVSDACGIATLTFDSTTVTTTEGYDLVGTWTATDDCGNETTASQTIHVLEDLTVVLTGVPNDTTIITSNGEIEPPLAAVTAADCLGNTFGVEFIRTFTVSPDGCDTTFVNTWTVEGDTVSASQTVVHIDENCPCVEPVLENVQTSPDFCDTANGAAIVTIMQDEADYTWTWSPDLGTPIGPNGNERSSLPAGDYTVTIENLGCSLEVDLTIAGDCDCIPAIIDSISVSSASCGESDATANIFIGNDATDYQYLWVPDLGTPMGAGNIRENMPAGHYAVFMTYEGNPDCVEKLEFDIFDDCARCAPLTDEIAVYREVGQSPTSVCLPVPFGSVVDFDIEVNGAMYQSGIQGCDEQNVIAYDYSTAFDMAQSGTFYVLWQHDGEVFSTVVSTMSQLAAGMNFIDPIGAWKNDAKSFQLISTNLNGDYNGLTLHHIPSETVTYHGPEQSEAFLGVEMILSVGENEVIFQNPQSTCSTEILATLDIPVVIFENETASIEGDCSNGDIPFCLDIPFLEVDDYEITVDGVLYTGESNGCDWETSKYYNYSILLGMGSAPFEVENWEIDGTSFGGFTFETIDELVDKMNEWDANGEWVKDENLNSIKTLYLDSDYGELKVKHLASSTTGTMEASEISKAHSRSILLPEGTHEIVATHIDGPTDAITVTVECQTATAVHEADEEDELEIFNGFSPNGDGQNDFFRITGLEKYPDHELTVFDHLGRKVFKTKDYRSDWGGSWGQNDLPNGTYYYVLTDGNGNRRMGYIQVKR